MKIAELWICIFFQQFTDICTGHQLGFLNPFWIHHHSAAPVLFLFPYCGGSSTVHFCRHRIWRIFLLSFLPHSGKPHERNGSAFAPPQVVHLTFTNVIKSLTLIKNRWLCQSSLDPAASLKCHEQVVKNEWPPSPVQVHLDLSNLILWGNNFCRFAYCPLLSVTIDFRVDTVSLWNLKLPRYARPYPSYTHTLPAAIAETYILRAIALRNLEFREKEQKQQRRC